MKPGIRTLVGRDAMIVMILALLIGVWTGTVSAQERTGAILKELVTAVERDVALMESKAEGYEKQRDVLLKKWDHTVKAINQERDPVKQADLRAELLVVSAQINKGSLEQVGGYLEAINSILPKLRQIKRELTGAKLGLREPLEAHRQKVGGFLTNAASILDQLKQTAPKGSQPEVAALENTLVGILSVWESPIMGSPREVGQIDRTIRELNAAFAQFITVQRLLEQERAALTAENYAAIAHLVLLRLGQGLDTRSISIAAGNERRKIGDRVSTLRALRGASPLSGGMPEGEGPRHPDDARALERIRRGKILSQQP